ncbi:MAG: ABC transporter permease [Spirochaetales bacterium]|nr:ABC transporter permease [Spirochaetales bacterium]
MVVLWLALRNLFLQRKRYVMVGAAVAIGFALITVISGAAYGAMDTVRAKAARYFAGHVTVRGYINGLNGLPDPSGVERVLRGMDDTIRTVARRTSYDRNDASLFFGGETVRQRKLMGVDFEAEADELSNLAFKDGSLDAMLGEAGFDGILISESAAGIMGCRVGDDVNLYLTTDSGQYNTATLIVRGIFSETSLFGYIAYVRLADLNRLLQRSADAATDIAVYLRAGVDHDAEAERIRLALSADFATYPPLPARESIHAALAADSAGPHLAVFTMDAQLDQIKSILDAFLAVTYFVLVVFVLIVMVGVLNTYRVIVYNRTREIGTMRAMGMRRGAVAALFITEALALAIIASGVGLALGLAVLQALRALSFDAIPAAGLFTDQGRLSYAMKPGVLWTNLAIMTTAVLAAALGPSRHAATIRPADAMRDNA